MRKLRLYLDTSVISHINAPHKPIEEAATLSFFRFVRTHSNRFELYISPVVQYEVDNCPENKRSSLKTFLFELDCIVLPALSEPEELAEKYLQEQVLGGQHYRDLAHIAYAVVSDCDFIISWNFKHFVNPQTSIRVNATNARYGYRSVTILSPAALQEALAHEEV